MSDNDLSPIPEFEPRAPIKLWRHAGIDCAIYMGFHSPCGYVRLPDDSPLRPIASAADVVFRSDQRGMFGKWIDKQPDGAFGHEGLSDLLETHGGLTFGPTEGGWIGFDTGHAFDVWDLDVLRQWIPEGTPERESFEKVAELGGHTSQIMGRHRIGYEIEWTLDKLVRSVESLADQVVLMARAEELHNNTTDGAPDGPTYPNDPS